MGRCGCICPTASELEDAIRNTCRVGKRTITYCVFPTDWFEDPSVGARTPPEATHAAAHAPAIVALEPRIGRFFGDC